MIICTIQQAPARVPADSASANDAASACCLACSTLTLDHCLSASQPATGTCPCHLCCHLAELLLKGQQQQQRLFWLDPQSGGHGSAFFFTATPKAAPCRSRGSGSSGPRAHSHFRWIFVDCLLIVVVVLCDTSITHGDSLLDLWGVNSGRVQALPLHKGADRSPFQSLPVFSSNLHLRARVAWGTPSMPGGVILCQEEQPLSHLILSKSCQIKSHSHSAYSLFEEDTLWYLHLPMLDARFMAESYNSACEDYTPELHRDIIAQIAQDLFLIHSTRWGCTPVEIPNTFGTDQRFWESHWLAEAKWKQAYASTKWHKTDLEWTVQSTQSVFCQFYVLYLLPVTNSHWREEDPAIGWHTSESNDALCWFSKFPF